jgi:hypothetical protein
VSARRAGIDRASTNLREYRLPARTSEEERKVTRALSSASLLESLRVTEVSGASMTPSDRFALRQRFGSLYFPRNERWANQIEAQI